MVDDRGGDGRGVRGVREALLERCARRGLSFAACCLGWLARRGGQDRGGGDRDGRNVRCAPSLELCAGASRAIGIGASRSMHVFMWDVGCLLMAPHCMLPRPIEFTQWTSPWGS